MFVYMLVTLDKYELPLIVADSPKELAARTGEKATSISRQICRSKKYGRRCQYVKVDIGNG